MELGREDLRIGVFAYNFPHYKTAMGLLTLCAHGYRPIMVFLQAKKKLKHHQSVLRYSPRNQRVPDSIDVCNALNLEWSRAEHNSKRVLALIEAFGLNLGVILGARILSKEVIDAFKYGIINMHPGLLPENRGLDNHKWAIVDHLKQGVTVHLIDEGIDTGPIIRRTTIPVYLDDSLVDIHLRLQDEERTQLLLTLDNFYKNGMSEQDGVAKYNKAMITKEDVLVLQNFDFYKQYYEYMEE